MVTITMLGVHKSGKTTYMGMMFNRFMDGAAEITLNGQENQIRIVPVSPEERSNIANWRKNNDTFGITEGKFPGATTGVANVCSFRFYLKANGETLSDFLFTDYPGEALEEILLNPNSNDYTNLAQTISQSDAVIVFVDGVKLAYSETEYEARDAVKCSYLNDAIARAAQIEGYEITNERNDGKKKLHIIFAITKCDSLQEGEDAGLEEKLKKAFNLTFNNYETSVFKVMSIGRNSIQPNIKCKVTDDGKYIWDDDPIILRGEGHYFAPENIVSILIAALAKCNKTRKETLENTKQQLIGRRKKCEEDLAAMSGFEKLLFRRNYNRIKSELDACKDEIAETHRQIAACDKYKAILAGIIEQKL